MRIWGPTGRINNKTIRIIIVIMIILIILVCLKIETLLVLLLVSLLLWAPQRVPSLNTDRQTGSPWRAFPTAGPPKACLTGRNPEIAPKKRGLKPLLAFVEGNHHSSDFVGAGIWCTHSGAFLFGRFGREQTAGHSWSTWLFHNLLGPSVSQKDTYGF